MYDNPSDFCRAAYEFYSGLPLPIDVICKKYNLTCLMSASRTGLASSADSIYYLCRDIDDQTYRLYESDSVLSGCNVPDTAPQVLTPQEAALWVLAHSSIDALIAALRHYDSYHNDIVSSSAVPGNFATFEEDDDLYDALEDEEEDSSLPF